MEIAFILLFFTISLIGVGYPLLRREDRDSPLALTISKDGSRDLSHEIKILHKALADLEFDHKLKRITDTDYEEIRLRYVNEIRTLQEKNSERIQIETQAIDEAIEREVRRIRGQRRREKEEG